MTNKNNNLITKRKLANRGGFSLIEIISVTVISSMLLICAVGIFNRLQSATEAMNEKLDKQDIADEILQRIAEDLDRLAVPGFDTQLTVNNKTENGFNKTQLIIENKIYDKKNKPITFEKIVWQSEYDIMEEMPILYRYHGGLCLEDKILDGELQGEQADGTELYIPVAWGMTHFQIEIPKEDSEPLTQWSQKKLPTSVAIKISFAEATEDFEGTLEVA